MTDAGLDLVVNGQPMALPDGACVSDVVAAMDPAGRGAAVAVNAEVVPRSQWSTTGLAPGDQVEVVTAVQGG